MDISFITKTFRCVNIQYPSYITTLYIYFLALEKMPNYMISFLLSNMTEGALEVTKVRMHCKNLKNFIVCCKYNYWCIYISNFEFKYVLQHICNFQYSFSNNFNRNPYWGKLCVVDTYMYVRCKHINTRWT